MSGRANIVKLGGSFGGRFRFTVGRRADRLAVAFEVAPTGKVPAVMAEAVTVAQARKMAAELADAAKRLRAAASAQAAKVPAPKRGFFARLTGR